MLQIPRGEVLRYLGMRDAQPDERQEALLERARRQALELCAPRTVCERFALERREDGLSVCGTTLVLRGRDIQNHLAGCTHCVLMAATLGMRIQKAIAAEQSRSVEAALYLDACATAAQELRRRYGSLTARFSPGYGDLPLSVQQDFLSALNAGKRIGLFLTESSLLTPGKSVTAVLGIGRSGEASGCASCTQRERCAYRREGNHCGNSPMDQA